MVTRLASAVIIVSAAAAAAAAFLPGRRALVLDALPLVFGAIALLALVRAAHLVATREHGRPMFDRALRTRPPSSEQIPELAGLERSLTLAAGAAFDVHYRVRPILREIAAHRLATGHGIDLDREPERARRVLGADAWDLVRADRERPDDVFAPGLSTEHLRAVVDSLERI